MQIVRLGEVIMTIRDQFKKATDAAYGAGYYAALTDISSGETANWKLNKGSLMGVRQIEERIAERLLLLNEDS